MDEQRYVQYMNLLKEYVIKNAQDMNREPKGMLQHPYIVPSSPGSPYYSKSLWDWDSWFASVVLGQVEADTQKEGQFFDYESGCIKNFLEVMTDEGFIPVEISENDFLTMPPVDSTDPHSQNMHKPVLAQHAAFLTQRKQDAEWVRPYMGKIGTFLTRYLKSHTHEETGLAYWQTDFAVGVDNDPSVFYRPNKSCGSIFLNCLLYRELLAYGYLLEQLGQMDEANKWRDRASDLADAIHTYCWDERDGTFYSVDLGLVEVDSENWLHSGAPRNWSSILLRIDNWSSFLPLWAGIATQEEAERMVARYKEPRTFNCQFGIRTLSRLEKMYDLRASHNPSNWLGPVWGVSNYLLFRGLQKYGYFEEADEIAMKTVCLFGQDLQINGCLHEYYNPDNGEPIVTSGFENWNFLVLNMIAHLENRKMVKEF